MNSTNKIEVKSNVTETSKKKPRNGIVLMLDQRHEFIEATVGVMRNDVEATELLNLESKLWAIENDVLDNIVKEEIKMRIENIDWKN